MPYDRESNYILDIINLTDDTQVNASAENDQTLQPDVGYIYEIVGMNADIPDPAGSGSGTHGLYISQTGASTDLARCVATTGTACNINNLYGFAGDSSEVPNGTAEQFNTMHTWLVCNNDHPIIFKYKNDTDVNKTGNRYLYITVKIYREAV